MPSFLERKLAGCRAQFAGGKRPAPTEPAGETSAPRSCPYGRAAQERKLGKQRSVFPGWRRTALSVLANASPPPPEGEARPGFLQASGGLPTWLSLRESWHGAAVTERANQKLPQGRRKEEGQVRGKTQVLCGVALIRPQGRVSRCLRPFSPLT